MNPTATRKRIKYYAEQLLQGVQLDQDASQALGQILAEIANGRDANEAFGLKHSRGHSESDDIARRNLRLVFSFISSATEQSEALEPYTLEEAFELGSELMRRLTNSKDTDRYDVSYLKKRWYDPKFQDLKNPIMTVWEENSPFNPPLKSTTPNS